MDKIVQFKLKPIKMIGDIHIFFFFVLFYVISTSLTYLLVMLYLFARMRQMMLEMDSGCLLYEEDG